MSGWSLSGQIAAEGRGARIDWMDGESTNSIKHLLVSRFCRLEIELHRPRLSKLNKQRLWSHWLGVSRNGDVIWSRKKYRSVGFWCRYSSLTRNNTEPCACVNVCGEKVQSITDPCRLTSSNYFWHLTEMWKCQPYGDAYGIKPFLPTCVSLWWFHELFI